MREKQIEFFGAAAGPRVKAAAARLKPPAALPKFAPAGQAAA
ncbi:MAG: hypothetical protein JWR16_2378 [Nevskia sp.]|nr:hypothetical protein [Nevskia sp.]